MMELIRVYTSTAYRADIEMLTPLSKKLETLKVDESQDTEVTVKKNKEGFEIETLSFFQEMVYNEKDKEWIKDSNSLNATM